MMVTFYIHLKTKRFSRNAKQLNRRYRGGFWYTHTVTNEQRGLTALKQAGYRCSDPAAPKINPAAYPCPICHKDVTPCYGNDGKHFTACMRMRGVSHAEFMALKRREG